ncbi:hypothetical protein ABT304_09095 [Nocardioides sp. NPDC000445]|uniref:restriction endonuclease-related protein n=1 Tax=Nocardioides sp. NPDC000445 TaxID=3154257 RepID=UPI0033209BD7
MVLEENSSHSVDQVSLVVTASVRAAVAWSMREVEPTRAWQEICRMVGVVNFASGPPGLVPGPIMLVDSLHEPLRHLAPDLDWSDEPLGEVAFIGSTGTVTPDVHEWAGDYGNALFSGSDDVGSRWLPPWAWQRGEQVEREFNASIRRGTDMDYAATREFVITHPAGIETTLIRDRNRMNALPAGNFGAIPVDRVLGGSWWPCPVCRWPMRVNGARVRCDIRSHESDFDVETPSRVDGRPTLQRRVGGRGAPRAVPAKGSKCVSESIWRFIVVPGLAELRLRDNLQKVAGVEVEMWPNRDRCDLAVTVGSTFLEVDVKDHARATSIIKDPPSVRWLVVPNARKKQLSVLAERLPSKEVRSTRQFLGHVKRIAASEVVR